ncbi:uncharacterized protein P174DRAFT_437785 [Aspergillus novofumigatus IBT 16806]|uniref:Uncharacterized protein n=1 Tax=Aspergillus novofumigatus (strain IBT 16806) TaxID=1392255 RepID=A0A2I1CP02_ASPN1|nr:uncharacterized protein P174DRAFT_437785 [Aspergillus novofumigatus IBT 16806]PKX99345.1 hypothetical protein P174DRAFT_437785 [Aspergillus novofumigatus IBT 16806]
MSSQDYYNQGHQPHYPQQPPQGYYPPQQGQYPPGYPPQQPQGYAPPQQPYQPPVRYNKVALLQRTKN